MLYGADVEYRVQIFFLFNFIDRYFDEHVDTQYGVDRGRWFRFVKCLISQL